MTMFRARRRAYTYGRTPFRSYSRRAGVLVARRKTYRRKTFVRGRDRTAGFYGRFSGQGEKEYKFFDTTLTSTDFVSTGQIFDSVCKIAQGTGESQRIGRKLIIRSIEYRWLLQLKQFDAAAVPGNPDSCRLIFYLDKQCNGAVATTLDILRTAALQSNSELENQMRFEIIYDKIFNFNYGGIASDGAGVVSASAVLRNYKWSKKLYVPVTYSGVGGALTDLRSNNIGFLVISNNQRITINGQCRIRFSEN